MFFLGCEKGGGRTIEKKKDIFLVGWRVKVRRVGRGKKRMMDTLSARDSHLFAQERREGGENLHVEEEGAVFGERRQGGRTHAVCWNWGFP